MTPLTQIKLLSFKDNFKGLVNLSLRNKLPNKFESPQRRPSASKCERSSLRSKSIDKAPRNGPGTSIRKVQRQLPWCSDTTGNSQMTNIVIAKPTPI